MSLPGGEDWLLRPVLEGMCRYESLTDGSISLNDIALMHDTLAVRDHNHRLYHQHKDRK